MQVWCVIVDTKQRRHIEPIPPKRRAGGGGVADLQRIAGVERPRDQTARTPRADLCASRRERLLRVRPDHCANAATVSWSVALLLMCSAGPRTECETVRK